MSEVKPETQQDDALIAYAAWSDPLPSWRPITSVEAFRAGYSAALAARSSADTNTLFERVRRLVVDHGIRDDENGELFADRLDDILRAALDGPQ